MAYDGSIKFDTKVDGAGFKKGLNKLQTMGVGAMKAVAKATAATAAAMGGVGLAATKVGMDFEKGMSKVGALSQATDKELQLLEKTALQLGKSTVFSATQASEGMSYLAMA